MERKQQDEYYDNPSMAFDDDNLSLGSMNSLGSIPGFETNNNFYMVQQSLLMGNTSNENSSDESGYETLPRTTELRHRFTIQNSDIDDEDDNYIPPPPIEQPVLSRSIDIQKWIYGVKCFYKLKSQYDMYEYLKYYLFGMMAILNIYMSYPMMWHEFVAMWIVCPFAGFVFIEYIQKSGLFNKTPSVSDTQLSYYPGNQYDYGCLIHIHYGHFHSSTYEFWVVYNESEDRLSQLVVRNYNYELPQDRPQF